MINKKLLLTFAISSVLTVAGCGSQQTVDSDGGEQTATTNDATPAVETDTATATDNSISVDDSIVVEANDNDITVDAPEVDVQTTDGSMAISVDEPDAVADMVAMMPEQSVIYFEFDSSEVMSEYKKVIAAHAAYIVANPDVTVFLEGHADERGSIEYNVALGKRRAESVASILELLGVSLPDDQIVSYGESRPAVRGSTDSAWSKNRRVEFKYN